MSVININPQFVELSNGIVCDKSALMIDYNVHIILLFMIGWNWRTRCFLSEKGMYWACT